MPGFPLPLRNALAELAIAAFEDPAAAAALDWLAAPAGVPSAAAAARLAAVHLVEPDGDRLLAVHAGHAAAAAGHAARAREAVRTFAGARNENRVTRACRVAAALWNERLFFEVHEVLEAVWKTSVGVERQALQGVIQIAVAFHHLAHANHRGARSLLGEGHGRLASVATATLPALDLARLLADIAPWESALASGGPLPEMPPRLTTSAA